MARGWPCAPSTRSAHVGTPTSPRRRNRRLPDAGRLRSPQPKLYCEGDGMVTHGRPPAFKVDDAGLRGAPGIAVHGELDIDTVQDLEAALDAAIRESEGAFIIDLSDVG